MTQTSATKANGSAPAAPRSHSKRVASPVVASNLPGETNGIASGNDIRQLANFVVLNEPRIVQTFLSEAARYQGLGQWNDMQWYREFATTLQTLCGAINQAPAVTETPPLAMAASA